MSVVLSRPKSRWISRVSALHWDAQEKLSKSTSGRATPKSPTWQERRGSREQLGAFKSPKFAIFADLYSNTLCMRIPIAAALATPRTRQTAKKQAQTNMQHLTCTVEEVAGRLCAWIRPVSPIRISQRKWNLTEAATGPWTLWTTVACRAAPAQTLLLLCCRVWTCIAGRKWISVRRPNFGVRHETLKEDWEEMET